MSDQALPKELDYESEPIKFLARAKKRATSRFAWNREATLEAGAEVAQALLLFRRDGEALRVAEFFGGREFTGHDKWYCTEHALGVAARMRRKRGDTAAAAAHIERMLAAGFVEGRLDGALIDRNRELVGLYVAEGNVNEETAYRTFLVNELTIVIEVAVVRGRNIAALEAEWEENVARLRVIRKVDDPSSTPSRIKNAKPKRRRRAGVKTLWKRIGKSLARLSNDTLASLHSPVDPAKLAKAMSELGIRLPRDVRDSYAIHDGQTEGSALIGGYRLLPLERVLAEWRVFKTLHDEGEFDGKETDTDAGIRPEWWNPGWVPIAGDGTGDFHCIDIAPAKGGSKGQVIHFVHDEAVRHVVAESFREWLLVFSDDLNDGAYRASDDEGLVPA
jgi:cell wall assembly regulator SMI1